MQPSKSAGLLGFLLGLINRAADHPAGKWDSAGALGMQAFYRQKGAGQLAKAETAVPGKVTFPEGEGQVVLSCRLPPLPGAAQTETIQGTSWMLNISE